MANTPKPKLPIQVIFAIILVMAVICTAIIVIVPGALPMNLKPAPTSTLSILPKQPLAKTSAFATDTPNPTWTSTLIPTDIPSATFTPTYATDQLPDLIVAAISDPTCVREPVASPGKVYVKFSVTVRNVGPVATRSFGPFSVLVNLILGQRRYSLEDWASSFNGVIGNSNMDISNLNPNEDVKLDLTIDLKGNTNFGIEAIANSGSNTIPESNTSNNILIQGFSVICV